MDNYSWSTTKSFLCSKCKFAFFFVELRFSIQFSFFFNSTQGWKRSAAADKSARILFLRFASFDFVGVMFRYKWVDLFQYLICYKSFAWSFCKELSL